MGQIVHAINDELIKVEHSINLFNNYGGEKSLKCCDTGGHNSKRPKMIKNEIGEFFKKYLYDNGFEEDIAKKYLEKNENNIMNDINNYYEDDVNENCEENEEEEDDNNIEENNIENENKIDINDDMYEEDYIMNQIIESQKNEKSKGKTNENKINNINININKKKESKNNLEEKRIEKIIKEEKNQMEQVKQALMNLNIGSNNGNKFINSENVDLLDKEEEYKNNSGNDENFENGGKF